MINNDFLMQKHGGPKQDFLVLLFSFQLNLLNLCHLFFVEISST